MSIHAKNQQELLHAQQQQQQQETAAVIMENRQHPRPKLDDKSGHQHGRDSSSIPSKPTTTTNTAPITLVYCIDDMAQPSSILTTNYDNTLLPSNGGSSRTSSSCSSRTSSSCLAVAKQHCHEPFRYLESCQQRLGNDHPGHQLS
jgi:hypothetical protein